MIDLARLLDEALGSGKIVRLSPESLALFLDTEQWVDDHEEWSVGDDEPDATQFDQIDAIVAKALAELMLNPLIGTIFPLVTADLPEGALECDGATYLRTDYPTLYAAMDAAFIVDADNFTVPDLRGRTIIGSGSGTGLSAYSPGDNGGEESHHLIVAEMPSHAHNVTDLGHTHTEGNAIPNVTTIGPGAPEPTALPAVGVTGVGFTGISIQTAGDDNPHENRQPYVAMRYALWAN